MFKSILGHVYNMHYATSSVTSEVNDELKIKLEWG